MSSIVALAQWIGLPVAIISFFVDRSWVADVGTWLYENVSALSFVWDFVALVCVAIAQTWRMLTGPLRELISSLVRFEFPTWGIDTLTIGLLLALGQVRYFLAWRNSIRQFRAAWTREFASIIANDPKAADENWTRERNEAFKGVIEEIKIGTSPLVGALKAYMRKGRKLTREVVANAAREAFVPIYGADAESTVLVAAVLIYDEEELRRESRRITIAYASAAIALVVVLVVEWLVVAR